MRFECYSDWDQLASLKNELFSQSSLTSLFLSAAWFRTLSASIAQDSQPVRFACVQDDQSLLALLPVIILENHQWQSFTHRYTALYSLLMNTGLREEVLQCMAEGVSRLSVRSIHMYPVADDDQKLLILQQSMEPFGFRSQSGFRFYNWYHRTQGQSFGQYISTRPSKLRNTIDRKRRKLEREHEYRFSIYRGAEVEAALEDYHAAYHASWKAHEQYRDFLDTLAINMSEPDWTRLAVLYIDDEPAAAQLWFVVHGKASIFRLAYDEKWKAFSPGTLLTAWLMEYVLDVDRVDEIDFLVGNESYKQDWMTARRERYSLTLYREPEQKKKGFVSGLKDMFTPRSN